MIYNSQNQPCKEEEHFTDKENALANITAETALSYKLNSDFM